MSATRRWARPYTSLVPGALVAIVLAAIATAVGRLAPLVGAPVLGLVLGVLLALLRSPSSRLRPGIAFSSRQLLQIAVALLGFQLTLTQALGVGLHALPVMIGTLLVCLIGAAVIGVLLRVPSDLRTLIGVGTAICGGSAIVATTAVIEATAADVAYALSTVFVFNAVAVVLFPAIGHMLHMSQHAFGLFAGTAVNDTSSVVATSTVYGSVARGDAIVTKLTRTLFIIPICLVLAVRRKGEDGLRRVRLHGLVPWFLVAFVVAATVTSLVSIPRTVITADETLTIFLITTALVAIGLSTDLKALRRAGPRPLIFGAALWALISVASLGLQAVTGTL